MEDFMRRWWGKVVTGLIFIPFGSVMFPMHDRFLGGAKKWLLMFGGAGLVLLGAAVLLAGIAQKVRSKPE